MYLLIRIQHNKIKQEKLNNTKHKIPNKQQAKSKPKMAHLMERSALSSQFHLIVLGDETEIDDVCGFGHEEEEDADWED